MQSPFRSAEPVQSILTPDEAEDLGVLRDVHPIRAGFGLLWHGGDCHRTRGAAAAYGADRGEVV